MCCARNLGRIKRTLGYGFYAAMIFSYRIIRHEFAFVTPIVNRPICIHLFWDYYSGSFLSRSLSEYEVLNLPSQTTLQTKQKTPGF
jgi:hypothetical protein